MPPQFKAACDGSFLGSELLIHARSSQSHIAPSNVKNEIPSSNNSWILGAVIREILEPQRDLPGITAGRNFEVIFQLPLIAVVHEVHAGVHVAVPHPRELRNVTVPFCGIVPDEVIASSGKLNIADRLRAGICSYQLHAHRGSLSDRMPSFGCRVLQNQDGFLRREI